MGCLGAMVKYGAITAAVVAVLVAGLKAYSRPARLFSLSDIPDQANNRIIVTGGNSGVGFVSAKELYRNNAHVIMATRSPAKALKAIEDIKAEVTSSEGSITFMKLDLSSLQSVEDFAAAFTAKYDRLDVLMNNAAVMAPPYGETVDGNEMQYGTNVVGHYHLTNLLRPVLEASAPSRIVYVSSRAHTMVSDLVLPPEAKADYEPWGWYGQTKLANILHARHLAKHYAETGQEVCATVLHPGFVKTNLMRNVGDLYGSVGVTIGEVIRNLFALSAEDGAVTQLFLATHPDGAVKCGSYYKPLAVETDTTQYGEDEGLTAKLLDYCDSVVAKFHATHA